MIDDGLIDMTHDAIRVLLAGRMLVRNIAAIFDRYHRTSDAATLLAHDLIDQDTHAALPRPNGISRRSFEYS